MFKFAAALAASAASASAWDAWGLNGGNQGWGGVQDPLDYVGLSSDWGYQGADPYRGQAFGWADPRGIYRENPWGRADPWGTQSYVGYGARKAPVRRSDENPDLEEVPDLDDVKDIVEEGEIDNKEREEDVQEIPAKKSSQIDIGDYYRGRDKWGSYLDSYAATRGYSGDYGYGYGYEPVVRTVGPRTVGQKGRVHGIRRPYDNVHSHRRDLDLDYGYGSYPRDTSPEGPYSYGLGYGAVGTVGPRTVGQSGRVHGIRRPYDNVHSHRRDLDLDYGYGSYPRDRDYGYGIGSYGYGYDGAVRTVGPRTVGQQGRAIGVRRPYDDVHRHGYAAGW